MASNYPTSLDSFATSHTDGINEVIHASDINNQADAINKIEAELGVNPSGAFSTIAAALAATGANPHFLVYDQTGVTNAAPALQTAIDAGYRLIIIPEGTFYCNSAVFDDREDGNSGLYIIAHGVLFKAGTGLPTVAEWNSFMTGHSLLSSTLWFIFPSTYRTALSAGVVTCTNNFVQGTATLGGTKSGLHPHLIVDGGTWSANSITNHNAGFAFGNRGGAIELRSMKMENGRALMSWYDYVDGNKMRNCAGWGQGNIPSTEDQALFYQIGNGDGVVIDGTKTSNYIWTAKMYACNGAHILGNIGGAFKFTGCHAINITANHTETANNITNAPRLTYEIDSSHVTITGSFDYLSNTITDGTIYLNDNGGEGQHSTIMVNNYFGRHFLDPATTDPVGGQAIYINKMNDRSVINVHSSWSQTSVSNAAFGQAYGIAGLPVNGNTTNEPTLTTALVAGRDHIGSGSFTIYKYSNSSVAGGQNSAMTIGIGGHGNLARLYTSKAHVTPTFFNREHYGVGTLVSGTTYAYAAALCNTLPDGTTQYGQATAEWTIAADATGVNVTELYLPTAAGAGATLYIWRCDTTGVLAGTGANFRYVVIPVGSGATRVFDTGANISKLPWITTSVPVPNSVAATNHTADGLYLNGTAITIP